MNTSGDVKGSMLAVFLAVFLMITPIVAFAADDTGDTSSSDSSQTTDTQPADNDSSLEEESQSTESDSEATEAEPAEKEAEAQALESTLSGTQEEEPTGVAEKQFLIPDEFIPDNNFGGARFKIPLKTYPGRAGLTPDLTLTYNSQRGNGWIGVGWNFDMGYIQRNPRLGIDYTANDFVVVKDGTIISELKSRENDWGTGYYGAKIENQFTKYYYNGASWVATSRDGIKYYYGSTSDSRQDNSQSGIFKWCLDKVEDTNGNQIKVFYHRSSSGHLYLERIEYNYKDDESPGVTITFCRELRKDTGGNPYDYVTYGDGKSFKILAYRLKSIDIQASGQRTRAYAFDYSQKYESKESRLTTITQYDADATVNVNTGEVSGNHLPPIILDYQDGSAGFQWSSWSTSDLIIAQTMDFNGDGITDFFNGFTYGNPLEPNGIKVIYSDGEGLENDSYPMDIWIENIALGDYNGDGRIDVISGNEGSTNFYRVYYSNSEGEYSYQYIGSSGPSFVLGIMGSSITADFDGDGKTDILGFPQYAGMTVAYSNGQQHSPQFQNQVVDYITTPDYVLVGDFNGDGKADIVCRTNNQTKFYYSTGRGFTSGVSYSGVTLLFDPTTGQYNNWIGDFNGDGLADIAVAFRDSYFQTESVSIYYSTGDGFYTKTFDNIDLVFEPSFKIGYGWVYKLKQIAFADFNEDGLTDILSGFGGSQAKIYYSTGMDFKGITHSDLSLGSSEYYNRVEDFNGDGKADLGYIYSSTQFRLNKSMTPLDLLTSVENDNGMGRSINITYEPYMIYEDHNLPFAVQTVSSVTADPGSNQGIVSVDFEYEGGKYDVANRRYLGFESVTKTYAANGTYETSLYHQDEFTIGRKHQSDFYEPGSPGSLLVSTTWNLDIWPTTFSEWKFVRLNQKDIKYYDDDIETASGTETYTYDTENGLVLTASVSGTNLGETVTTSHSYSNISQAWIWRVATEQLSGSLTGLARHTANTYDAFGNLETETRYCNDAQSYDLITTYAYDAYGNVISVQVGSNPATTTIFESLFHAFPETITIGLTLQTYRTYNYRYGTVATERDPNQHTTTFGYDLYGRVTSVDFPDNGLKTISYHDDVLPRYIETSVRQSAENSILAYDYFDGFGRKIQTSKLGDSYYITTQLEYDNMGRNGYIKGPFFAYSSTYNASAYGAFSSVTNSFDSRNRLISADRGSGVTTIYSYSGLDTSILDPDQKEKIETKDWLGRLRTVKETKSGQQYTTQYTYNAAGDLTSVTDTNGNTTTMTYNTLGQKIAMNDMDMGSWTYAYNNNGNMVNQYAPNGKNTIFIYDGLNRVIQKQFSDSTPTAFFVYDACQNGMGRLCSIENSNTTTTFTYDIMGRVVTETKSIIGGGGPYVTAYEYWDDGKLKSIDYPGNGPTVFYTYYPGSDLLDTVYAGMVTYAAFYNYEPTGLPGGIEYQNGAVTTYSYDRLLARLSRLTTTSGGNTIQDYEYLYTMRGNVSSVIDNHSSVTYNYAYDDLHRLTSESISGGGTTMTLDYDPLGNIVSKSTSGNNLVYTYGTAGKPHRLTTITQNGNAYNYAYDANGNMTTSFDLVNPANVMQRSIVYNAEICPSRSTSSPMEAGRLQVLGLLMTRTARGS